MTWQLLLMDANAIVCLLIMVRLMFFRKEGKRHRLSVAVLAYLVILAAGFNAFNILLGHYVQVNLASSQCTAKSLPGHARMVRGNR